MRALIVTAVLGIGSALVFGAAALTMMLFPTGGTVSTGWAANGWDPNVRGGIAVPVPEPMPAIEPGVIVDDGIVVPDEDFRALPGDTVTVDGNGVILEAVPEP